jgi:putative peptidoglycan lipid II flippase
MFPGFRAEPAKFALTVFLNRMLFPYIFFISLVALCMGILNTVRHFFTPAISTVFLNFSIIGCTIFLHTRFSIPIMSFAIGVLLGGLIQLMLQLPTLYKKGFPITFRFNPRHPAVFRIALLMGPSVFGVGVYYLNITVGNILASYLPQGSVSYLYYAQRLFEFPLGIFTVSVAQAVLPSMCRQASAGDIDQLKESLTFGLKLILFITIPAMVGLMACSVPVFSLLFMGGAFDYNAAVQSAHALFAYTLGLPLVAMIRILAPAFYSMKDTKIPAITAFIAFILNAAFSLLLMRQLKHNGLALASSLSSLCNMILLLWLMRRKIGAYNGRSIISTATKSLLASLPMGIVVYWGLGFMDWTIKGHKLAKSGILLSTIGAGIILFFAVAYLLRCDETQEIMRLLKKRRTRAI